MDALIAIAHASTRARSLEKQETARPAQPRTTYASWWERLLLIPKNVGYHLDHHLGIRARATEAGRGIRWEYFFRADGNGEGKHVG